MKKAVIFTHEPSEGPAIFGEVLPARGFSQNILFTPDDPVDDADADLLIVMGGPQGVYESDKYPYLKEEMKIIERRIARGKPVLGVCLGSQLMAAALGAKVYKGSQGPEIGWHDITVNKAGKTTPVRHLDGAMFHWHGDTFDLPQGATLLASSEKYPHQAFSYGKNALALQCHPEVTAHALEGWYEAFANDMGAAKTEQLRAETARNIEILNTKAVLFFDEWLESVRSQ